MTIVNGVAVFPGARIRRRSSLDGIALLAIAIILTSIFAMAQGARASTVTTLYSFCSQANCTDGASPATLIQATDGNLYGLAVGDGIADGGVFFKLSLGGTFSALYGFCGLETCDSNGFGVVGDLLQAPDGEFYGAQLFGGTRGNNGTLFKVSPSGSQAALVDMTAKFSNPDGLLFDAADNLFYGFSQSVKATDGLIFTVTPTGSIKLLYSFCSAPDCTDGNEPVSMIQGNDGNFYGTTNVGGNASNCGTEGCGTIFKITPGGVLTTLYSFCPAGTCNGRFYPTLAFQGTDGNLYGFTLYGGPANNNSQCVGDGCGTIFKITPEGKFTRLYSFCSQANCADGVIPQALIQGSDGNLYGTTYAGGSQANSDCDGDEGRQTCGTLFTLTPSGTLTTLYNFCSEAKCADGATPGYLIQDTNGDFYGVTSNGGAHTWGAVFHLSKGLGPFVQTQVPFAKVGTSVAILGTDLTGATSVTFNGKAASFTAASASEITATIPSGATTGYIKVVTPGGTLQSSAKFGVSP